jgi:hypothetical protein
MMNEWLGGTQLLNGAQSNMLDVFPKAPSSNMSADINALKNDMSALYYSLSAEMSEVKKLLTSMETEMKQTKAPVSSPPPTVQAHTTHESFLPESNSMCIPWSRSDAQNRTMQPFDFWMLHNPHWFQVNETDDEFCVARGDLQDDRVKDFLMMYATQFYSGCKKVNWRYQWLSGWG